MDGQISPRTSRIRDREQKRASRACDGCRRQKERCDGGVPCRRCTRLRRQCEFSGRSQPAGSPGSDTYTRSGLPRANDVDLARRLEYLEKIAQRHAGSDAALDMDTLQNMARAERPASRAETPSHSSDFGGVNEKFTMQPLQGNVTHYSGEFSHWNFSMRIKDWIDRNVTKDSQESAPVTRFDEYYRPEELHSPQAFSSLSSLPPRAIVDFLVHCFFEHAEANYFFVDREWLKSNVDTIYRNADSLSVRDMGMVCVFFSILAIGTQYAYLDSCTVTGQHDNLFTEDAIGKTFYQRASRLLPDVIATSSLESVQACLLLGLYALPVDASGLAYIYLNLALKLAIQNGMHRKYPGNLPAPVREMRNRVWWTLYTIEKRVGIFHGRPMSIASVDVDADYPAGSPGSVHIAHFLATLELNQYLTKLAHEMSVLRTAHKSSECTKNLVNLLRELHDWWGALDKGECCRDTTSQSHTTRQHMHLKLEYCLMRIYIGRVFILPQDVAWDTRTRTRSDASASGRSHRSVLVVDCLEAALAVIDACRLLRNSIGLARASYTEFSSCRAALLVIITQCVHKPSYRFRRALQDGLDMLKEMSAGSQSAHSEASLIEAFDKAIASMGAAPVPASSSEYANFKRWERLCHGSQGTSPLEEQSTAEQAGRDDAALMPSCTPFFGVDGNFSSFPHDLDEISAFLWNDAPSFAPVAD